MINPRIPGEPDFSGINQNEPHIYEVLYNLPWTIDEAAIVALRVKDIDGERSPELRAQLLLRKSIGNSQQLTDDARGRVKDGTSPIENLRLRDTGYETRDGKEGILVSRHLGNSLEH